MSYTVSGFSKICLHVSKNCYDGFRFLQATVDGLHESQPPAVRISAVRAIYGFCDHLKVSSTTQILVPFLPPIMEGLIQLATQFASDVLALVMETISIVLTVSY